MAIRTYLLAVDDPGVTWTKKPGRQVLSEGVHEIPVLWASLFAEEDTWNDVFKGGKGEVAIPNWCVNAAAARRRLHTLRKPIATLFDENAQRLWAQWLKFIMSRREAFFKTNAAELWAADRNGYERYRKKLQRAFTRPSTLTMKNALKANGLDLAKKHIISPFEADASLCKLGGCEHGLSLPWWSRRGRTPSPFWDSPPDEKRTVRDEIYHAISPHDSLEEAIRKARAIAKRGALDTERKRRGSPG